MEDRNQDAARFTVKVRSGRVTFHLLLVVAACQGATDSPPYIWNNTGGPTSTVSVTGAATVGTGRTIQLTATARNIAGNVIADRTTFAWSSSNDSIASVNTTGLVTGKVPGTALISASRENVLGTFAVAVTGAAVVGSPR